MSTGHALEELGVASMTESTQSSLAQYLSGVLNGVAPLRSFQLPLLDAVDSVLSADLTAPTPIPVYDSAAISGYAVSSKEIDNATAHRPALLSVIGEIGIDSWHPVRLPMRGCFVITAGAPLPAGADSVIPADWTDQGMVTLKVYRPGSPEHNVVRAGTECAEGELLATKGEQLNPALVGQLALAGFATVPARPKPRVITLGIGNELADAGVSSTPGRVVDASSYVLTAAARQSFAQAFRLDTIGEDPQRLKRALDDNAMRADLLLLTGLQLADTIAPVFPEVEFRALSVAPGGVVGFGRIGSEQTPVVCLPGDAGAAYVGFELLGRPILRRLSALEPVFRSSVRATLTESVNSERGVREFRPAILRERRGGGHTVTPRQGGKQLLRGLVASNGLMVLSDSITVAPAGTVVDVLQLDR